MILTFIPFTSGTWMIARMALSEDLKRSLQALTKTHATWCDDVTKYVAKFGECLSSQEDVKGVDSKHTDARILKTETALEDRLLTTLLEMDRVMDEVWGVGKACEQFMMKTFPDCYPEGTHSPPINTPF